jgi:hypothetical protein
LEGDLVKFYKGSDLQIVGAVHDDSGGYFLAMRHSTAHASRSTFYVEDINGPMDSQTLQDCLNEHQQNRGAVFCTLLSKHTNIWLIVFEIPVVEQRKSYIVMDFPRKDLRKSTNFPDELANRID